MKALVFSVLIALAGAGCGHAPPRPSAEVTAAEQKRRERLPDDQRTLDVKWDDVRVRVSYADGRTEATMELRHPKIRFFYQPAAEPEAHAKPAAPADRSVKAVPRSLRGMAPVDVDRIEIHGGELVFVDMSKPAKSEIWLSDLEVSVENVASRPGLAEGRPMLITASAKVQHSGRLALFVSVDPWSQDLNFSGRASLEALQTKELYSFMADTAKLQAPQGTLDLYVAFAAKDGHLIGGVKPILKNVQVTPVQGGAFARFKSWFANSVLAVSSDRVTGRNAVATVVPISGDLKGPKAQLWPTLAGVLYNAYKEGIAAGFGGVPAPRGSHAGAEPARPGPCVPGRARCPPPAVALGGKP